MIILKKPYQRRIDYILQFT